MIFLDSIEKKILAESTTYAEREGFVLNPDEKTLNAVISALAKNLNSKGAKYCPCRALTGKKAEDDKKICPCAFHKGEIREQGHCMCRLFWKKPFLF